MAHTEVKFGVRFMDWQKDEVATFKKERADKYIRLGVCAEVKPPVKKKKRASAPSNKMETGATTK